MNEPERYTSLLQHFACYFDACDRADFDGVVQILAGTTVTVGEFSTSDPIEIRRAYESRQSPPLPSGLRTTKHHLTNLVVTEDEGEIHATGYYFRLEPGTDHPVIATSGRIEQVLVRVHERWQVRQHRIITDF